MIRATTGGVLRSYRSNLMNSFITDNKARETVLSQRVFNSYAEDPAAAAKAFRLRKSRMMTSSQLDICDDVYHKYQGAFACLQKVDELVDTSNSSSDVSTLKSTTLKMLSDPTGDAREQLNKVLDNLDDTIIQNLNQTYGDEFIFAGADGHNVPFEVKEVDGAKKLYYRGVPVDAQMPELMKDKTGADVKLDSDTYVLASAETVPTLEKREVDAGGDPVTIVATNGTNYYLQPGASPINEDGFKALPEDEQAKYTETSVFTPPLDENAKFYYKTEDLIPKDEYDATYARVMKDAAGSPIEIEIDGEKYNIIDGKNTVISQDDYDKACQDAEKLEYLANEKRFVDIGLGFQEDENGKLIESSAFNECLSGLTFVGYGLDEDGDPKNIYSIVQQLKDLAATAPNAGDWSTELYDEFDRLVGKLEGASDQFKTQFTNQSAGVEKLKNNCELLEDNVYTLKEQYSNLEDVNMADAISSFIWAEYCYNAALKVGNSILSQSLMDYLQ